MSDPLRAEPETGTRQVRMHLAEVGGRISQELGLGRVFGQILVFLYLREGECSLDQIGHELGLSKAAVSVAARQLENLGLVRRSWKRGDRRNYYRTADNIAVALQQGLFRLVGQKIHAAGQELDRVNDMLEAMAGGSEGNEDVKFLYDRVKRAKTLRDRAASLLRNPLVRLFVE